MFERPQSSLLKKRIDEPRRFIQVITGPRQVGKTTMVRQFKENAGYPVHYASADEGFTSGQVWIDQQWETARLLMRQTEGGPAVLILDEIQKIPDWSQAVKLQWDKDTLDNLPLKVILLGSASLLIQQGLSESLAGRFELIYLPHWSFTEMEAAFGFSPEEYVWLGGYPGAAGLADEPERWRDYVLNSLIETTISKDILMLVRVEKPALLKRLFELGCAYSGQMLSYNKMLGQLHEAGNATTLSHYLNLLESAGVLAGLEKYGKTLLSARASSPKLQALNNAFTTVYSPLNMHQAMSDLTFWGRKVESAIGAHLYNEGKKHGLRVFYWREGNNEVDFVLVKQNQAIGIEVKSGLTSKAPGMQVFQTKFKPYKVLLVGQTGITWQEFLKISPADLF